MQGCLQPVVAQHVASRPHLEYSGLFWLTAGLMGVPVVFAGVGTPLYMAPEVISGAAKYDAKRADIW